MTNAAANLRGLAMFGEVGLPFGDNGFLTVVVLVALALTSFYLLMRSHRYLKRQNRSDLPLVKLPRHGTEGQTSTRLKPDEVNRWQVEMHETARDLSAQLDSKMSALAQLIRDADRAANRLEKALATIETDATSSDSIGLDLEKLGEKHETPSASQANGLHRSESVKSEEASDSENQSQQQRYEEIYTLSDYGFDTPEIARRVDTPVGEIELILGLRDKR